MFPARKFGGRSDRPDRYIHSSTRTETINVIQCEITETINIATQDSIGETTFESETGRTSPER
jgi:hypothetical protein